MWRALGASPTTPPEESPTMATPNFRLDDRVALVTGASSGIGRAIAAGLAGSGAAVGCLDLAGSDVDGAVADIEAAGGRALAVTADVTDPEAVGSAVAAVEDGLG